MSRRQTMGTLRRKTLGPINPNTIKSRQSIGFAKNSRRSMAPTGRMSYAPGRPSLGGKRKSSIGRASMGRQSLSRRGSMYGRGMKISDPRPIGDKSYTQQNIKILITYLTSHDFEMTISPKILTSPTTRDFKHIITFLFQQFDPHFQFSDDKFEDEVKQYLKELGYPFTISRSSLKSAGSPHTWPSLLAALVWIIELLSYQEACDEAEEEKGVMSSDTSAEKFFFEYLCSSYNRFLEGEDDFEVLDQELKDTFDKRNAVINESIQKLEKERDQMERDIESLKRCSNELSDLEQKQKDLQADKQKFEELNKKLASHRDAYEAKIEERNVEKQSKDDTLKAMEQEKAELMQQLEQQEFSPMEVQRMTQEKSMLEEQNSTMDKQRSELEKKVWNLQMNICKHVEDVEQRVRAFNEKGAINGIIPASAKHAQGRDLELHFDTGAELMDDMINIDLKEELKPFLIELLQEHQDESRTAQEQLREVADQAQNANSVVREKEEDLSHLKKRLEKVQTTYQQERETMNEQLKVQVEQVEDIELELSRIRMSSSNDLEYTEKKLEQIDMEHKLMYTTMAEEKQGLHDKVCDAMELLTLHKSKVEERLREANDELSEMFVTME